MSDTTPEGPGDLAMRVNDAPVTTRQADIDLSLSMTDSSLRKLKRVAGFLRLAMPLSCEFNPTSFSLFDMLKC